MQKRLHEMTHTESSADFGTGFAAFAPILAVM